MTHHMYEKVGIYVDVANIAHNGGYGIHYDVLREFSCRNKGIATRLNAYVAYDEEEAKKNYEYRKKSQNFHSMLRDFGFKVIVKVVKWFYDESGHKFGKANADLDMAVDALLQSERLDYVLLVTGDGDFVQVVRALQNKGCRVEVLGFKNVAQSLKKEADWYTSGYLVPELLPFNDAEDSTHRKWGELDSKVRGICYSYNHEKGYGFMRFIKNVTGGLWITDSRKEESPYSTVFVHKSQIPDDTELSFLPNRDIIFEFDIAEGDKGPQAVNIKQICC